MSDARWYRVSVVAALALGLASCGGGGGGVTDAAQIQTPAHYTLAGTLAGLPPEMQVTLLNNGADALNLGANGAFRFAVNLDADSPYLVSVGAQPFWQSCHVANASGLARANVNNVEVQCQPAQGALSILAGTGSPGYADGPALAAAFNQPAGVAVAPNGDIIVADHGNAVLRRISVAGVVDTLAGNAALRGATAGTGFAAVFTSPQGLSTDALGNVIFADNGIDLVWRVDNLGDAAILAGGARRPGIVNGTGTAAGFNNPYGVASDTGGNVYVADTSNNAIRQITAAGVVTTLLAPGAAGVGSLNSPRGIALDSRGNLFIANTFSSTILELPPGGAPSILAGSGNNQFADGVGAAASFFYPTGIAVDPSGILFIADTLNCSIRMITPPNLVSTVAGTGSCQGTSPGAGGALGTVSYVTQDIEGRLIVSDSSNHIVWRVAPIHP
jgi:sugar lactone lactonase YvrE